MIAATGTHLKDVACVDKNLHTSSLISSTKIKFKMSQMIATNDIIIKTTLMLNWV